MLDASGIPMPTSVDGVTQKPLAGVSFLSTYTDANAKPVRERQYFEIFSNRAIYDHGWIAAAQHTLPWRQGYAPGNWDKDKWELYNIDEDYSEANDLAAKNPQKLAEMKKLFDEEAAKAARARCISMGRRSGKVRFLRPWRDASASIPSASARIRGLLYPTPTSFRLPLPGRLRRKRWTSSRRPSQQGWNKPDEAWLLTNRRAGFLSGGYESRQLKEKRLRRCCDRRSLKGGALGSC